MKAWKLNGIGDIQYDKDVPEPKFAANEALVRVKAAGICGSDVQRVYVNGAHQMPLIIGHEFSGVVTAIGDKVSEKWVGKRVGIFPLIPCRQCQACLSKKYELCSQYRYLGSRSNGGFAEYVSVPEWNLIELPNNVTFEQAAMLEPMAVAVHAIRRLNITADMSVAVCGMGTIGQLIVMFLLESGISNVYAIGNKAAQKESLMNLGLPTEHFYDMNEGNVHKWVGLKTSGHGVNVYFECVGKNETIALGLDIASAGGQVCLVGNPYSDINMNKDQYWKILRKQLVISGSWNSSYLGELDEDALSDDWNYVLSKLENGKIFPEKLNTHRLRLEELKAGLEIMRDKTEYYLKVMVID